MKTARALLRSGELEPSSDRPLLADLSRRRAGRRRCWIFRIRFLDARNDVVWDTLFGIGEDAGVSRARSAAELRVVLGAWRRAEEAASVAAAAIEHSVRGSLGPVIILSAARELSIRRTILQRSARMAASLVQRSLFDHRIDRAAAAQQGIADEALRRCAVRLAQLDAWRSISPRQRELVFAVVLD